MVQDNSGYLCGREMPDLLRALGRNSVHTLIPPHSFWKSNNIVEWKFIVSYDFRNPTCDELNTIMAEVRLLHCIVNDTDAKNKCMFFSLIHHLNVFGWF